MVRPTRVRLLAKVPRRLVSRSFAPCDGGTTTHSQAAKVVCVPAGTRQPSPPTAGELLRWLLLHLTLKKQTSIPR